MKKGVLIYNPVAGRRPTGRERDACRAAELLRAAGLKIELAPTTGPQMAGALASAAVERGADVVFACGGDGTINEVVNGLAGTPAALGILPAGTANIVARELRLPLHPVRAARQFRQWSARRIALGHAQWEDSGIATSGVSAPRRYYISVAGVGFDAHIVYKLSPQLKLRWGVAGYVLESFRQLLPYPFPEFAACFNGQARQGTFAVIHRTKLYAGWLHLAPSAGLFKPELALCSFASRSRLRYLLYATMVMARQHMHLHDVALDICTEVRCAPVDPGATIRFELDGELAGILPATFKIVPDALTLLAPAAGS